METKKIMKLKTVLEPVNLRVYNEVNNLFRSKIDYEALNTGLTIGVSMHSYSAVIDDADVLFSIWLLYPGKRFENLRPAFYKGGSVGLVLGDNDTSNEEVQQRLDCMHKYIPLTDASKLDNIENEMHNLSRNFVNSVQDREFDCSISDEGYVCRSPEEVIIKPIKSGYLEKILNSIIPLSRIGSIDVRITGSPDKGYVAKLEVESD